MFYERILSLFLLLLTNQHVAFAGGPEARPDHVGKLPTDLVTTIAHYQSAEEIANLSATSKSVRNAIVNNPDKSTPGTAKPVRDYTHFLHLVNQGYFDFYHIQFEPIATNSTWVAGELSQILRYLSDHHADEVQSLDLSQWNLYTTTLLNGNEDHVIPLLFKFRNLKKLKLFQTWNSLSAPDFFFLSRLPRLTELSLANVGEAQGAFLFLSPDVHTELRSLDLENITLTQTIIEYLALFKSLKDLKVDNCTSNLQSFQIRTGLNALRTARPDLVITGNPRPDATEREWQEMSF